MLLVFATGVARLAAPAAGRPPGRRAAGAVRGLGSRRLRPGRRAGRKRSSSSTGTVSTSACSRSSSRFSGRGRLERWVDGLGARDRRRRLCRARESLVSRVLPGSGPADAAAGVERSAQLPARLLERARHLRRVSRSRSCSGRRSRTGGSGEAVAFAVFPVLGAVVYLTSSRGAIAAIAGGALVFVLAQPQPLGSARRGRRRGRWDRSGRRRPRGASGARRRRTGSGGSATDGHEAAVLIPPRVRGDRRRRRGRRRPCEGGCRRRDGRRDASARRPRRCGPVSGGRSRRGGRSVTSRGSRQPGRRRLTPAGTSSATTC